MLTLTRPQRQMLEGARGPALGMAMRMVVGIARVKGAESLIGITRAHIDSCLYHGDSGLAYAQRLADLGGACAVPTTANVGSLDLLHREFRPRSELTARGGARLMELYAQLGVQRTWTCAPYHLPSRPGLGEHIAWAESNAIVFANSVLGARTDRYGDFLDICAAITGFAPFAGLHLEENRRPTLHLDCRRITGRGEHVLPLLGYLAGTRAGTGVPYISGLAEAPDEEGLKALGAAAASAGGVALFHVEGVTPESAAAEHAAAEAPTVELTDGDLLWARGELSGLPSGHPIDAVSLGTPHASLARLRALAAELRMPEAVRLRVPVWVSTGRATLSRLRERCPDDASVLDAAGVRIVTDTCTYLHPLSDETVRAVMTDSAKWAHYAPGNIGVSVAFGSMEACVRAARTGCVP